MPRSLDGTKFCPLGKSVLNYEILGSRFIAILGFFDDESSFSSILSSIKEEYPKATHYCYACKVGVNERMSDDGEPSRSVGLPLLNLLHNENLDDAYLVVVRYFGGTKLGLPRLKRTYANLAKDAIFKAELAEMEEGEELLLSLSYHDFEAYKKGWDKDGTEYEIKEFGEKVSLLYRGDAKIADEFKKHLLEGAVLDEKKVIIKRRINNDSCK
jgi:uncharacterized YigZ family protein